MTGRQPDQVGIPLCSTDHERAFVEALLLHCRQKQKEDRNKPTRMTHAQIQTIIRDRHDIELDPQQFQRLKRKYVTLLPVDPNGEVRPASRFELLREICKGRLHTASEYEMTGLLSAVVPSNGAER